MLGKLTFLRQYLTFAAFSLTAANGFQIYAQALRRLQYRGTNGNPPA
jgi:hypothetical protein